MNSRLRNDVDDESKHHLPKLVDKSSGQLIMIGFM